ncbi:MAG: efflux RND transporter periplasmic adaptor subunit [Ignavibacteria bacterium]|jgi:HlyD family secretion protein
MAKKSHKARNLTLIGLGIFIIIIGYFMFRPKDETIPVSTDKVSKRTITQRVSAIGKIRPETEVKISSEASGEIITLGFRDGDSVTRGQLLVRIQPDIVTSQLEQFTASADASKIAIDAARAEMDRANADFKRINDLFAKQYASKEELDRAKALMDQAVSRFKASGSEYSRSFSALKQMRSQASRTTIYAPMSGTVTNLSVEAGEKVVGTAQMQGTEMMRIADLNVMNAWVDVDENDIVFVKIGDTARIRVDAMPEVELLGYVYEIGHSAKTAAAGTQEEVTNFQVKIRIIDKNKQLRPGMSCSVEIDTDTHYDVLSVPLQAVTVRMNADKTEEESGSITEDKSAKKIMTKRPPSVVFIKDGNTAKMVRVETGLSDRGFIEISKGLSAGQEIISGSFQAVNKLLMNGSVIRIDNGTSPVNGGK